MPDIQDLPDNYPWLPGSGRYPMVDEGELAARLGSPYTFDRRGAVVWMDNFSHGLGPWRVTGDGDGNKVTIVSFTSYRGPYAAELTSGSTGTYVSQLYRMFAPMKIGRMGNLCGVALVDAFDTFHVRLGRFHNGTDHQGRLILRDVEEDLAILDENEDIISIASLYEVQNAFYRYHEMKLVVDFVTNKYVRAVFNDVEYDLSDYNLVELETVEDPCYAARYHLYGNDGDNDKAYISHSVITIGEP